MKKTSKTYIITFGIIFIWLAFIQTNSTAQNPCFLAKHITSAYVSKSYIPLYSGSILAYNLPDSQSCLTEIITCSAFKISVQTVVIISLSAVLFLLILLFHLSKNKKINNKIKDYETELKSNRKKIKNIFSIFSDIYFRTDNRGISIDVSPSVLKITGYDAGYYIGKHISYVFAKPEEWNEVAEILQNDETIQEKLYTLKTNVNNNPVCSVSIKVFKDNNGNITGYEGILKDFTRLLSTRQKIEGLEKELNTCFSFTKTGMSKFRTFRKNIYVNDHFLSILGHKELFKTMKINSFWELIHKDDRQNTKDVFNKLLENKASAITINCRFKDINNNFLWFTNNFSITKYSKSMEPIEITGLHTLTNDLKNLEIEIQHYKHKLSEIYKTTNLMLFVLKDDLSIIDINDLVSKYLNIPASKITGTKLSDLYNNDNRHILKDLNTLVLDSIDKKINIYKHELICRQTQKHFNVSTNIYRIDKNLKCILILEDVTTQKNNETQTQNKLSLLEKKEKENSRIISKLNEELESNIREIISASEFLSSKTLTEQAKKNILSIKENSQKLLEIINNFYVYPEKKNLIPRLNIENFDIPEFTTTIYAHLKNNITNSEVKLSLKLTNESPKRSLSTDPAKLNDLIFKMVKHICQNLESGEILIDVNNKNKICIFNIKASSQQKVINMDDLQSRPVKNLVELLNGKLVTYTINPNEYCCEISIPDKDQKNKPETTVIDNKKIARVLIVEDEDYNVYYLAQILKMAGYETIVAEDGYKAISTVEQDKKIDLILMDIRLPGLNGLEASKKIKTLRPDLPIIAQTAFNLNSEEDHIMEKYCDDYIQKPIISQLLYEKINRILNNKDDKR